MTEKIIVYQATADDFGFQQQKIEIILRFVAKTINRIVILRNEVTKDLIFSFENGWFQDPSIPLRSARDDKTGVCLQSEPSTLCRQLERITG